MLKERKKNSHVNEIESCYMSAHDKKPQNTFKRRNEQKKKKKPVVEDFASFIHTYARERC